MTERYGVRSKLNAGAGEGGGGGEPTCVCNNHIHDATSVALGGFTKYIPVDIPSDAHWSVLAYHSEYAELIHNAGTTGVPISLHGLLASAVLCSFREDVQVNLLCMAWYYSTVLCPSPFTGCYIQQYVWCCAYIHTYMYKGHPIYATRQQRSKFYCQYRIYV